MINLKTRRIKTAALAALLTVTLLAAAGCKRNLFPASGVVAGWDKGDKTQTFDASTLWQYIDGGADQYVNAGLVSAATSDYKYQGNLEAVVDIYTMKTAAGAQKVFEADPPLDAKTPQLGDAARLYERSLVFRKGKYLVRITAYQAVPGEADALLALANAIASKM
jgi:hypothetical protein